MSSATPSRGVPGSVAEGGKEPYRAVAPDKRGLAIGSLTFDEISKANRSAQIDGVVAGTCAGFLGSFGTSRVLKQNKNLALISGLMTGVLTGSSLIPTSYTPHSFAHESTSTSIEAAELTDFYAGRTELGYYFTQASLSTHLAKASAASTTLREAMEKEREMNGGMSKFEREGGTAGMEEFHDKYNTTRGDH